MTPTVYFIDDSATMREVIKIAFRRENIEVVACNDGASAIERMERERPDVVISDVIMPEKDGYEVCQYIKQHGNLSGVPVILMSGVVNRAVAEKAFAVKADELIRKPFQPQELISRVRKLLEPKEAAPAMSATASAAALSSIFSAARTGAPRPAQAPVTPVTPRPVVAAPPAPEPVAARPAPAPPPAAVAPAIQPASPSQPPARPALGTDMAKLRIEVLRLEHLVKKLQAELEAEREYSRALEAHIKTLQDSE